MNHRTITFFGCLTVALTVLPVSLSRALSISLPPPGSTASGTGDQDGDNTLDNVDNCPEDYNMGQVDDDRDGIGNACDNCPLVANPLQEPSEDDEFFGAACIRDIDADGVPDSRDKCPYVADDQSDSNGNGIGDACERQVDTTLAPQRPIFVQATGAATMQGGGCSLIPTKRRS